MIRKVNEINSTNTLEADKYDIFDSAVGILCSVTMKFKKIEMLLEFIEKFRDFVVRNILSQFVHHKCLEFICVVFEYFHIINSILIFVGKKHVIRVE